jgi:20S proteasome subunit alpha 1
MSRETGFDRNLTVFSPEGRLYQVEYAFKAARAPGLTTIGVRGVDCVVLCTEKRVPDRNIVADSVTHLFNISPRIGCCMTGLLPDSRAVVTRLRYEAAEYRNKYGYVCPVEMLANRAGDLAQLNTQEARMRVYGCITMLCGIDEELGPQLYKVDPAGLSLGYKATAAGAKEQEAVNFIEKLWKKADGKFTRDQAIQAAIECLQQVTSQEFKATDIEVGIVTTDNPSFRKLEDEAVEDHLNAISARD